MRWRLPRQSELRNAPGASRSSRLRKRVHQTRATFGSQGSCANVSGSGTADELGCLGAVADVLAVTVGEEVRGRAVDELESLLGDRLPVLRGDALAHDAAGDRGELVVDVLDAARVDLAANVADARGPAAGADEVLEVGALLRPRGRFPGCRSSRARSGTRFSQPRQPSLSICAGSVAAPKERRGPACFVRSEA